MTPWLTSIPNPSSTVQPLASASRTNRVRGGLGITSQTSMSMTSNFSTSFFNELAAVPSLHVGFAVVVGFALFAAVRNPLRWVFLLWGPIVTLAVVATGNHFVFDAIAGLAAAAAGYGLALMAARIRVKRPVRSTGSSLGPAFAEA